jgi:hypothetical protein
MFFLLTAISNKTEDTLKHTADIWYMYLLNYKTGSEEQVDVFIKSNNIICKNINKFLKSPCSFRKD